MQHILRIEIKGFIRIVESILIMFCCITDVAVIPFSSGYNGKTCGDKSADYYTKTAD